MPRVFRTNVILVLLCTAGSARAQPAPRLAGVHALINSQSALAWADNDTLHIWRIDLTGFSASWTAIPAPPELKTFTDRSKEEGSPQVHVNFAPDGAMRVFWADNEVEFGEVHFKFDLHQAESRDEGLTWRTDRSTLVEPSGGAKNVVQCNFVDGEHGWMLLFGDGGAGAQPEMLATTADGGHTWKTVADSDRSGVGDWPWGYGAQSLIVRSAADASFVTARNMGSDLPLAAGWTEDGGHTWIDPVLQESSWVGYNAELAQLKDDPLRPHHFCVDALLDRMIRNRTVIDMARYCSDDDGRTWLPPVPVPLPTAVAGDSSIPVYADTTLGFAEVWGDLNTPRPAYRLFVTRDAGKTWKPAPASIEMIEGHYQSSDNVVVTQTDEQGDDIWLLLTVHGDSPHSDLFFSGDHGVTWQLVPAAASR